MRTPNHQRYLDNQYFSRMDREIYGTPVLINKPMPPLNFERLEGRISKLQAGQNALENRVNGLMKMGHTHSKKVNKYNTYSV